MAAHNLTGNYGEALIWQMFAQENIPVQRGQRADLNVAGVEIEIKTARPSRYGKTIGYQFLIQKPGHTTHLHAQIVVLLCLDYDNQPRAAYVVPTEHIRSDRQKYTVPYTLNTRLAEYADRWELIAEVA